MSNSLLQLPSDLQCIIESRLNIQEKARLHIAACKREKQKASIKKLGVLFKAIKKNRIEKPCKRIAEEFIKAREYQSVSELAEVNAEFKEQVASFDKHKVLDNTQEDLTSQLVSRSLHELDFSDVEHLCKVLTPAQFDKMQLFKSEHFIGIPSTGLLYAMGTRNEALFEHIIERQYFGDRIQLQSRMSSTIKYMHTHDVKKLEKIIEWFHPISPEILKDIYTYTIQSMYIEASDFLDSRYGALLD